VVATLTEHAEKLNAMVLFTFSFDMSGSPTITLPCGFTEAGMPVAFQFATPHLGEAMLVRAGYALQSATDWHCAHPALVA
jgi:amidase